MTVREFELNYPNGPHIHRDLTEAALKTFIGRVDMKIRDVGTGWAWYLLPTFFDGALGIGIELGFNQSNLEGRALDLKPTTKKRLIQPATCLTRKSHAAGQIDAPSGTLPILSRHCGESSLRC